MAHVQLEQEFQSILTLDSSIHVAPLAPVKNKFSRNLLNSSSLDTPGTVLHTRSKLWHRFVAEVESHFYSLNISLGNLYAYKLLFEGK